MPLETGFWKIGDRTKPMRIIPATIDYEARLETILQADISVVSEPRRWMVIGRQVPTAHGGRIDLLAIDKSGVLIVLELKRDRTDREVVSQVLDYASWVQELDYAAIASIFNKHGSETTNAVPLQVAFQNYFSVPIPEEVNTSQELVIVASGLHPESERVVRYLQHNFGVPVNAVFSTFFRDGEAEYLSRSWLVAPSEVSERDEVSPQRWNGEFYASFGYPRDVVEAGMEYGFLVAGGGDWYARSLDMLNPGDRVWVHLGRGRGFGGVARVLEARQPVDSFVVDRGGQQVPVSAVVTSPLTTVAADPDKAEYAVRLEWLHKVPYDEGVWEKGFLANQNTVARPLSPKWQYTVDRLRALWRISTA